MRIICSCQFKETCVPKPPAGPFIHSRRDHKRVDIDILALTIRNPREVDAGGYFRAKPPAGSFIHSRRDHKRVDIDILALTIRNPREVDAGGYFRAKPPAGLSIPSRYDYSEIVEDIITQSQQEVDAGG